LRFFKQFELNGPRREGHFNRLPLRWVRQFLRLSAGVLDASAGVCLRGSDASNCIKEFCSGIYHLYGRQLIITGDRLLMPASPAYRWNLNHTMRSGSSITRCASTIRSKYSRLYL